MGHQHRLDVRDDTELILQAGEQSPGVQSPPVSCSLEDVAKALGCYGTLHKLLVLAPST